MPVFSTNFSLSIAMLKISIVPDTNVLLSDLELVKQLYTHHIPILYTVNFSRTVLEELDWQKTKMVEARNAIRFIESVSSSLKTEIEGKVDERRMDVEVEAREKIEPKNNDDRILNYCFQLENPILLTNDKAFILKCESFNIKSVKIDGLAVDEVIFSILKVTGLADVPAMDSYIERVKVVVEATIRPTIVMILYRELGESVTSALHQGSGLEFYLGLVKTNFNIFKNYISSQAPKVIDEFLSAIANKDVLKVKKLLHPICMIFRQSFEGDRF